jgi:hypothetical protein
MIQELHKVELVGGPGCGATISWPPDPEAESVVVRHPLGYSQYLLEESGSTAVYERESNHSKDHQ